MIKPIYNECDYQKALMRVEALWGVKQDTAEGDELDVLIILIEAYEAKNYVMPASDSIEPFFSF